MICFINLPNCIQWDQVKNNTKWFKAKGVCGHEFLTSIIKPYFSHLIFLLFSNSSKYFKICNTTDVFFKARVMFCILKLPLYISSFNYKKNDTLVMSLSYLFSLTLWNFVATFYYNEIPDPKDFPEQTGWRKYITIKRS